jgi:hypothetical protein
MSTLILQFLVYCSLIFFVPNFPVLISVGYAILISVSYAWLYAIDGVYKYKNDINEEEQNYAMNAFC